MSQNMSCYITCVMHVMCHLNCISFQCNCENSVLFALSEKYKTALIYLADHNFLSWRNPLYLNHVIDSIFGSCRNVLYLFRLSHIQRRLSGIKNKSKRVSRAFTQPSCKVFQCFNIEDFQSRIIEWTSCEK